MGLTTQAATQVMVTPPAGNNFTVLGHNDWPGALPGSLPVRIRGSSGHVTRSALKQWRAGHGITCTPGGMVPAHIE